MEFDTYAEAVAYIGRNQNTVDNGYALTLFKEGEKYKVERTKKDADDSEE